MARVRETFEATNPRQAKVRDARLPDGTWSSDRKVWIAHLRDTAQDKYEDKSQPDSADRDEALRQLRMEAAQENAHRRMCTQPSVTSLLHEGP